MPATLSDRIVRPAERLARGAAMPAIGLALLLGAAWLYYTAGRGLSFFYDEWDIVLGRRQNDAAAFFAPHNGHLIAAPVAVYKLLMALFGLRHYGPYRFVEIGLHLACAALLYLLVRRRLGSGLALVVAASILFLGRAWQDLLWPFQITYLGAVAGGLFALLLVERRTATADFVATLALLTALLCSGLGVPFVVLVAVTLLLNRADRRRLWIVALPVLAYCVWYLHWGQSELTVSNAHTVPRYVYDSLAGSVGAIFGVAPRTGKVLAAIVLLATALVCMRRRRFAAAAPPAAAALTFWVLAALTRGQLQEPTASRYLYPGAVFLLLIAVGLAVDLRVPVPVVVALGVVVAVASVSNVRALHQGATGLRTTDVAVDAELAILQLERAYVSPGFQLDAARAPQLTAGPYFAAIGDLGSPALPIAALPTQSSDVRAAVDDELVRIAAPVLVRPGNERHTSTGPAVDGFGAGVLVRRDGCVDFRPSTHSAVPPSFDLTLPARGLVLRSSRPVDLYLRRFADAYPTSVSVRASGGTRVLEPPPDASTQAWHVRVAPRGATSACSPA